MIVRLTTFLIIISLTGYAQEKYLILKKKNRPYSIIFQEGDEMRFKLKGERFFTKALIQGFGKDDIRFHYYRIKLDEIAEIDVASKNFTIFSFRSGPGKLLISGLAFVAIDQFNQTVVNDESFGIDSNTALIGAALTSSGIALKLIQKKRWKFRKRKHKMEIVDFRNND
ncbi:MAG: hypothetical protein AAGG59_12630 [Bacteroidota bacterium]